MLFAVIVRNRMFVAGRFIQEKLNSVLKKLKRFIRRIAECAELVFCKLFFGKSGRKCAGKIILIQNSHLGDFVLSLPFFERLKNECKLPLVLVSDHRIRELADASGIFDEFIGIDFKRASSYKHLICRWKTLIKLRKLSAEKAIQCFGVGKTGLEDCMLAVIKAPEKYVFVDNFYNVQRSGTFYEALRVKFFNKALPYRLELSLAANENNFATFITGNEKTVDIGDLEMFEPLPERDESLGKYCLIIPGSDDPRRRWEAEKFACLARQVVAEQQLDIIFSGTASEQEIIRKIASLLPEEVQKKIKIRQPEPDKLKSIKRLMSDCKHAQLVMTNDTGPMHIAAKYKVKTICITGGWHWGIFAPCKEYKSVKFVNKEMSCYNCGSFCKYQTTPFKCLQELSVNAILIN